MRALTPSSDATPLVGTTTAELRRYAPFDEMEAAAIGFLAARLRIAYYPRGQLIVSPESGEIDRLYLIRQGAVRRSRGGPELTLSPGECFPIGALIGRRATSYAYHSEEDTFCWELAAEDFHRLLAESARFHAFCSNHLAVLVARSNRMLREQAGEGLLDAAGMLAPLRAALARQPVSCAPDTSIGDVLKTMQAKRVGSMVITDAESHPSGIFTQPDALARVALPQVALGEPISRVMTREPVTLEEDATLAEAAIAMARRGIRHVVVTRQGKFAGVISERDLFALQRITLSHASQRIQLAGTLEALMAAAGDVRQLTRQLLAQGVAAEHLSAMASALNDALTQRLIAMVAARHGLSGPWCWLALGSEGRMEQTFATDQDNALIYTDAAGKRAFLAFADEVNHGLAACGFPLCTGNVMASNRRWCLTPAQWRGAFREWLGHPEGEALLNASIFLDFRPLAGDARLGVDLREDVSAMVRERGAIWRALAQNALRIKLPLGVLRDFASDEPFNLKLYGALTFVEAARVLALAHGIADTGTAARLRAAHAAGALSAEDADGAVAAFHYVQALRLKRQALGEGDPNQVAPAALNAIDRRVLREALRQAAMLQDVLRVHYR
jgi:CBS domain-containing protein